MQEWISGAWSWVSNNSKPLSTFISLGTLFVWLFYAQLLLAGFQRQRQARVLINQGWGRGIDSVCLISNMSHEPIYIQCVILVMKTSRGEYRSSVTDLDEPRSRDVRAKPSEITRQGPLLSGNQMNLGSFSTLIRQAAQQHGLACKGDPIENIGLKDVTVTVISSYGPEGGVIGTQRRFFVAGDDDSEMTPASIDSRRLINRRARRKMRRWLEESV